MVGRLGMHPDWLALAPDWISTDDLSPLSLEAHSLDLQGRNWITNVFRLEQIGELAQFLSSREGVRVRPLVTNASKELPIPSLSHAALSRVRRMFRHESELYGL